MEELSDGLLEIKFNKMDDKIIMTWLGECININPSNTLSPYFDKLFTSLNKEKELEIDFSKLQYMKSSIVPYIVKFVTKLNKEKIKTRLLYNSFSNWQTATFKALISVVSMMNYIEVIGVKEKKII